MLDVVVVAVGEPRRQPVRLDSASILEDAPGVTVAAVVLRQFDQSMNRCRKEKWYQPATQHQVRTAVPRVQRGCGNQQREERVLEAHAVSALLRARPDVPAEDGLRH